MAKPQPNSGHFDVNADIGLKVAGFQTVGCIESQEIETVLLALIWCTADVCDICIAVKV